MKVRALKLGYYGHERRREGDVFILKPLKKIKTDPKTGERKELTISPEQQFSTRWMEKVDEAVPEVRMPRTAKVDKI